jgi:hypothetical protein
VAQGKFNGKVRTLYNKHLAAELGSTFVMYNSHGDNEITYFELCLPTKLSNLMLMTTMIKSIIAELRRQERIT